MVLMAETQIAFKMHNGFTVHIVFLIELIFFEVVWIFDIEIMCTENIENLVWQ